MRLTAEQIERIVREVEALDYGEVVIRLQGQGRDIRVLVTRSLLLPGQEADRPPPQNPLDAGKGDRVDSR